MLDTIVPQEMQGAIKVVGLTQEAMAHLAEASREMWQVAVRAIQEREQKIGQLMKQLSLSNDMLASHMKRAAEAEAMADSYLSDIAMLIERRSR